MQTKQFSQSELLGAPGGEIDNNYQAIDYLVTNVAKENQI